MLDIVGEGHDEKVLEWKESLVERITDDPHSTSCMVKLTFILACINSLWYVMYTVWTHRAILGFNFSQLWC